MKIQFEEGILLVVKPKCWNLDGNFRGKIVNVKNKPRSIIHPCPRGFRVASQFPLAPSPPAFSTNLSQLLLMLFYRKMKNDTVRS